MREAEKPRPLTLRTRLIARLIYSLVAGIWATLRLKVEGIEAAEAALREAGGGILVIWHGYALFPAFYFRGRGFWALVSLSRDGDIQTRNFQLFGFQVVRGSTGRGGVRATREVVEALRGGGVLTFTPDGPRGPAYKVQPGVVYFAAKADRPVIPVGFAAAPAWRLATWDRYLIPWPFARARLVFGDPVRIAAGEDTEAACATLESALNAAKAAAEAGFSPPDHP